jgi:hypothetical protein
MKAKWITTAILASALTAPAFAQVGIYIGRTPPPLRYEVRPAMPGAGYTWVDGFGTGPAVGMSGSPEYGVDRPTLVRTGAILTMTTTTADGPTMRVIGTTKITVTTTNGITTTTMITTNLLIGPGRKRPGLCLPFSIFS